MKPIFEVVSANRFKVSGKINLNTVVELRDKSLQLMSAADELTIDMKEVTNGDSASLPLITSWIRYAHQNNKPIHFENLPKQIQDIATISGLAKYIT